MPLNFSVGLVGLMFAIGFVFVAEAVNVGSLECRKEGQRWNMCESQCPATCQNLEPDCPFKCVRGCACQKNYVFENDKKEKCILQTQCTGTAPPIPDPQVCSGQNEEFSTCAPAVACAPSCEADNLPCPDECTEGCMCKYGYVRNAMHICILQSDCSHSAIRQPQSHSVAPGASPPVAHSPVGNSPYGRYPVAHSPARHAPVALSPVAQSSAVHAPVALSPVAQSSAVHAPVALSPVAHSPAGHAPVAHSPAVHAPAVPKCTGVNEVHGPCGDDSCEPTCDERTINCIHCSPGCACQDGYIRHNGVCIPVEQCPCPGENEVHGSCGDDSCEPTCDQRTINCIHCSPGCACQKDYIRNEAFGKCIPVRECPAGESVFSQSQSAHTDLMVNSPKDTDNKPRPSTHKSYHSFNPLGWLIRLYFAIISLF